MATEEFEKFREEVLQKLNELLEEAEKIENIKGELGGLWKEHKNLSQYHGILETIVKLQGNEVDRLEKKVKELCDHPFTEEEISILKEICCWDNFWGEEGHLDKLRESVKKLEEEIKNLKLYYLGKGFFINDKFVPYMNGEISDIHLYDHPRTEEKIELDAFKAKVKKVLKHYYSLWLNDHAPDCVGISLHLLSDYIFDEDVIGD